MESAAPHRFIPSLRRAALGGVTVMLIVVAARAALAEAAPQNPLDAPRAFGYLKQLCDLGPRPSGSDAMREQQVLLEKHFRGLGAEVELQKFAAKNPLGGARVPMANLVARWRPAADRRVLLCAHYDTRPLPDRDPNAFARTRGRFLGASDGASGAAVLMELAHHIGPLSERLGERAIGIDMVLFDGEELVYQERRDPYFLGSTWFAKQYAKRGGGRRYEAGILLDMVGDADLNIHPEGHSANWPETRPIVDRVWKTAERLGVTQFQSGVRHTVQDDHLPLRNIARIPTIDLIDFDYPYWHTEADTPRNCSGESLAAVGWVVLAWLEETATATP